MPKPHVRELSVLEYRELCKLCDKYLHNRFFRLMLPQCDFEDALMDTLYDAYERIASKREEIRNLKSFMKRVAYFCAAKALEKRKYRRNLIWIDGVKLVETQGDDYDENPDDEKVESGFVITDDGAGAEKVRLDAEARLDANTPPFWLRLFRKAEKAQKGKARKVLSALKKDSRHVIAAKIAGLARSSYYLILKKLQCDFALCFRAYHAYLKGEESDTFSSSRDYTGVRDNAA